MGLPRPEPPPPLPEYKEESPEDSEDELEVDRCFFKTISAKVEVVVVLLAVSSPSAIFCPAIFVFDKN